MDAAKHQGQDRPQVDPCSFGAFKLNLKDVLA